MVNAAASNAFSGRSDHHRVRTSIAKQTLWFIQYVNCVLYGLQKCSDILKLVVLVISRHTPGQNDRNLHAQGTTS